MSDAGKREWRFRFDDMIEFAKRILTYTDGFERPCFVMSGLTYHNRHHPNHHRHFGYNFLPWRVLLLPSRYRHL
jgi:hypothetical protein